MRITDIPVKHRQTVGYGCGHHVLANLFDDANMLLDIVPDIPSYEWMLDQSLWKRFDDDVFMRILLSVHSEHPTLNRVSDSWIMNITWNETEEANNYREKWFRPFFISVVGAKKNHLLLVIHKFDDDLLYVVDSLREYVVEYEREEFFQTYHVNCVSDLFRKSWAGNNDGSAFVMSREHFKHLFSNQTIAQEG